MYEEISGWDGWIRTSVMQESKSCALTDLATSQYSERKQYNTNFSSCQERNGKKIPYREKKTVWDTEYNKNRHNGASSGLSAEASSDAVERSARSGARTRFTWRAKSRRFFRQPQQSRLLSIPLSSWQPYRFERPRFRQDFSFRPARSFCLR